MEPTSNTQRPGIFSLLQQLVEDVQRLAAQQFRLALHEMQFEFGRLIRIAIALAGLGVLVSTLILVLVFAAITALHEFAQLPLWGSSLVIAGVLGMFVLALGLYAKEQVGRIRAYPARTLFLVKEDITWMKDRIISPKT